MAARAAGFQVSGEHREFKTNVGELGVIKGMAKGINILG